MAEKIYEWAYACWDDDTKSWLEAAPGTKTVKIGCVNDGAFKVADTISAETARDAFYKIKKINLKRALSYYERMRVIVKLHYYCMHYDEGKDNFEIVVDRNSNELK